MIRSSQSYHTFLNRVDMSQVTDVTAKAGTTMRIVIPITKTHPVPTATWTLNDKDLDDRANVEVFYYCKQWPH